MVLARWICVFSLLAAGVSCASEEDPVSTTQTGGSGGADASSGTGGVGGATGGTAGSSGSGAASGGADAGGSAGAGPTWVGLPDGWNVIVDRPFAQLDGANDNAGTGNWIPSSDPTALMDCSIDTASDDPVSSGSAIHCTFTPTNPSFRSLGHVDFTPTRSFYVGFSLKLLGTNPASFMEDLFRFGSDPEEQQTFPVSVGGSFTAPFVYVSLYSNSTEGWWSGFPPTWVPTIPTATWHKVELLFQVPSTAGPLELHAWLNGVESYDGTLGAVPGIPNDHFIHQIMGGWYIGELWFGHLLVAVPPT